MIDDLEYKIFIINDCSSSLLKGTNFDSNKDKILNSHSWELVITAKDKYFLEYKSYICKSCSARAGIIRLNMTYIHGELGLRCFTDDEKKVFDIII